jgi:hypothetical protein
MHGSYEIKNMRFFCFSSYEHKKNNVSSNQALERLISYYEHVKHLLKTEKVFISKLINLHIKMSEKKLTLVFFKNSFYVVFLPLFLLGKRDLRKSIL